MVPFDLGYDQGACKPNAAADTAHEARVENLSVRCRSDQREQREVDRSAIDRLAGGVQDADGELPTAEHPTKTLQCGLLSSSGELAETNAARAFL